MYEEFYEESEYAIKKGGIPFKDRKLMPGFGTCRTPCI